MLATNADDEATRRGVVLYRSIGVLMRSIPGSVARAAGREQILMDWRRSNARRR
jgi:hypothetical protein